MLVAMAGFTMEDLFVKKMSADLSTGQILLMLGLGGGTIFVAIALAKGHRLATGRYWNRGMILRFLSEAASGVSFVYAISILPLSTVAAVFQVTPLVITMGAALFLGEAVGWRRWAAILIGFTGVLIIIRPGFAVFNADIVFVLIAVLFVSMRDLITRWLPADVPSAVLSFQAFYAVAVVGGGMVMFGETTFQAPSGVQWAFIAGGVSFGVIGYFGLVLSTRIGEAAIVTPFRYSRLIFSLVVGFFIFSERPDLWTLLGATIVIVTGIYTVWRERIAARQA